MTIPVHVYIPLNTYMKILETLNYFYWLSAEIGIMYDFNFLVLGVMNL